MVWGDWPKVPLKPLSKIIIDEKSYNFHPYTYTPQGLLKNLFFTQPSRVVTLEPR